jgi:hypothetical protein
VPAPPGWRDIRPDLSMTPGSAGAASVYLSDPLKLEQLLTG